MQPCLGNQLRIILEMKALLPAGDLKEVINAHATPLN